MNDRQVSPCAAKTSWELVEAARSGDDLAFEELYRRYHLAVARRVSHLTAPHDHDTAADLVQETFVHALRGLASYRREAPFLHWILRIATNVARSHHRRTRRRQALLWFWRRPEAEREVAAPGRRVDDAYAELQAVHRALAQLSPRLREAVILFELEGVSLADMACQLAVPLHTAASRLRRGRQRLKRCLEQAGYGAGDLPVRQREGQEAGHSPPRAPATRQSVPPRLQGAVVVPLARSCEP